MKRSLLTLLLALSSQALALEATTRLDAIVIDEDRETIHRKIIRSDEIDRKQADDLEDVFRNSPDVTVGGAQSAAQRIFVRGLEDTNLNVSIDGARQGGYLFHRQGRLNIDPDLLKRVDVEAGTGNALAGPGALGGSIRFETKDIDDLLAPDRVFGSFFRARFATAADEKTLSASVFGRPTEKTGLLLYGKAAEAIDYQIGGGDRQPSTGAHPRSGLAKFTYRPSETQKLALSSMVVEDNARRTGRANFGLSSSNPPSDQEFTTVTNTLRYEFDPADPLIDFKADVFDSKTGIVLRRDNGTNSHANVRSNGVKFQNHFDFGDFDVTFGADANRDRSEAQSTAAGQTETGSILGLYSEAKYAFTPRLRFETGARFDSYTLTDVAGRELTKNHVSPSAALTYRFTEALDSRLSWSQAFRGPTPMEALLIANSLGAAPVGNLEGALAETSELSFAYRQGALKSELALYSTQIRHPIEARLVSSLVVRENGKDIPSRGFTLGTSFDFSSWILKGSFAHNEVEYGSEPIGYSGTSFGRGAALGDRLIVGADVRFPELGLAASFEGLVVFPMTRVPTGASQQPGYTTQDLTLEYFARENIRLGFAIANIFDVKYVSQGTPFVGDAGRSSLFEPGRDIRLSASAAF